MENVLPEAGLVSHAGSTVSVVEVAVRMNLDCPAPVPPVIQTIRPAHAPKLDPASVVEVPPVAVPEAAPLSMVMFEPMRVIAMLEPCQCLDGTVDQCGTIRPCSGVVGSTRVV